MTLSSTTNRVSFAGNDVTTAFSFPYYFLANADLVVILRSSAGVETTKTITTHYTVTGAGVQAGGTVTMLTAPATGETLAIYRDPAQTQDLDLVENDPMPAEEIEERFDKAMMIDQRLTSRMDRAVRLKESDAAATLEIPLLADRLSQFLAFDASGDLIAASAVTSGVTASSFMQTVLDDTTAAAARTTLGFTGASGTVATANIEDLAVTTAKIAAANVTKAKLDTSTTTQSNEVLNLGIAASVAASALTIAVKTKAGTDATATDIISVGMRNVTVTTGTYTERSISGALSVVVSSGSTLGHVSAQNQYAYIYLIDNAGTLELAVSSSIYDEGSVVSTTAEGAAGAADSYTAIYSTTARSNVPLRLIGRIKSNQATAGTWATAISEVSLAPFTSSPGFSRSEVMLNDASGFGSSSTAVNRWVTAVTNVGSDLTYADSGTLGGTITVNTNGIYTINFNYNGNGAGSYGCITINSGQLTTILPTDGSVRSACLDSGGNTAGHASFTGWLFAGDVVRFHSSTAGAQTQIQNASVVRIA